MIFTDRTVIVQKGTSSINDTIVLYRGDREVEIRFTLNESSPFKFGSGVTPNIIEKTEAAYGQLVIKTPGDKAPIFSEITATKKGAITFTITAEMIDEITEVGNYTFQIRLLDENKEGRVTIPEVVNGIEVREPIATEDISDTNEVGIAAVGYALTTAGTTEDTFDTQGNYNKTTWGTGDRITAAKLNKIEAGIDGVNKKVASGGTGSGGVADSVDWSNVQNKPTIPTKTSQLTNDSGYITSVPDEYITEAELKAKKYTTEQYVDDVVHNAIIGNEYTHPSTHPASMITGLSTVATSGSYNDLTDKPIIPTRTSQLSNDSDFVDSAFVSRKIADASLSGGEVDLSGYVTKETGNANQITFADGQTFQAKLDAGILKGDTGAIGPKGEKGDKGDPGVNNINDTTASATTTYSSNKIESIKEDLRSQIRVIENYSLVKHTDGKVYIKKQDGTLVGTGVVVGGNTDLSKVTMSMDGQTLKLLNDGTQIATVEIPTATVTDEQLTAIIQSKIDDGTLGALTIKDNSITFDKLQKSYYGKTEGQVVDYWYYNNTPTKRTDGKSIEYPVIAGKNYRIPNAITSMFGIPYLLSEDKETVYVNKNNYYSIIIDGTYYFTPLINGYLSLCYSFSGNNYYPNIPIYCSDKGLDTSEWLGYENMWLKLLQTERINGLQRDYSGIWYNMLGSKSTNGQIPIYKVEDGYWYKSTSGFILIDDNYNFVKTHNESYVYADGTFRYIQPTNTGVILTKMKTGVTIGGGLPFIDETRNAVEYNKPLYKGIACFGDSIFAGGIPEKIGELGKCAITNYGSSGASTKRISKFITNYGETSDVQKTINEGHDTVLIQAGINDTVFSTIAESIPQSVTGNIKDILEGGTITVGGNTITSLDDYYTLFDQGMCGQLAFIIEWLQATYPNKRILICNYHNNTSRQERVVLQEKVAKEISEYYGVEFIDVRRSCNINPRNEDDYLKDRLHPNQDGNILIAKAILRKM